MSTPHSFAAHSAAPHSPWARVVGLGVALAAVVAIIVLAFSWPGVTSDPKNLPLVVVGPDAQVTQLEAALDERAEGLFDVSTADDRDAAVAAIEHRDAYGAIVLGESPEVLTASAASPVVAQQLAAFAGALQAQIQAAVAAQVPDGVTPPTVTVAVTDVVPLADADPRGTGLISAAFPLVLGGMIGGIALTLALVGAVRRVVALGIYAVVGGLVLAGILQGWFGVLQGSFLLNSAVFATALLAIGAPIVGFAALVGRPGIAIGPVLFLLIANPISSAAQPIEFLPEPWGAVGQWFPPGAGATLLRDASYFPAADTTFPWLVLAGWAALGILLAIAGHFRTTGGATEEAIEAAEPAAA
jgi:hypothetical protein